MTMGIILIVIGAQLVVGAVIVYVLKRLLVKELFAAALEKLQNIPAAQEVGAVKVTAHGPLDAQKRTQIEVIIQRKFPELKIDFQEDLGIKGGIVIELGNMRLDYSLADRLKRLWP